jgi:carbamate kinase
MCVATTQSEIGYLMQRALEQELIANGLDNMVAVIPTMVEVDPDDPAFKNPTKPIGPFYTKEVADQKKRKLGWDIVEDASRGYRRVVPSPLPKSVLQLELIKKTIEMDAIVIACGGCGIPVMKNENGVIEGLEAVIDKDRSSALLSGSLGVDMFIISTEADQAYLNFKKPNMQGIRKENVETMEQYMEEGHFAPGSMKPKVESVISFIKNGGKHALITNYEKLEEALKGNAGTHVVSE